MEFSLNEPIHFFSNCVITKGASKSSITDLQRGLIYFIPELLVSFLDQHDSVTVEKIISTFPNEKADIIDYFKYLYEEDVIFFSTTPNSFPPLDVAWDYPSTITNCIIDVNQKLINSYPEALTELDNFNCNHLQLRFFDRTDFECAAHIIDLLKDSSIHNIEIQINSPLSEDINTFREIIQKYPRISSIEIFGANNLIELLMQNPDEKIKIRNNKLNAKSCGIISEDYFVAFMDNYMESRFHNSCLNRKISIDFHGEIKNCPSMMESFGNISNTSLSEAIKKEDFKKYWDINKDKILVCQDCEFRYICTDCRAYVEDPNDIYSKPLKCGYNPYKGEWTEWSTNPLKKKGMVIYGFTEPLSLVQN